MTAGVTENLELLLSDRAAEEEELPPDIVLSRKLEVGELSELVALRDLNRPADLRGGEGGSSIFGGDAAPPDDIVLLLDLLRRLRPDTAICRLEGGFGRLFKVDAPPT